MSPPTVRTPGRTEELEVLCVWDNHHEDMFVVPCVSTLESLLPASLSPSPHLQCVSTLSSVFDSP